MSCTCTLSPEPQNPKPCTLSPKIEGVAHARRKLSQGLHVPVQHIRWPETTYIGIRLIRHKHIRYGYMEPLGKAWKWSGAWIHHPQGCLGLRL